MFRTHIDHIPSALLESPLGQAIPDGELAVLERIGTAIRFAAGRTAMVEDAIGRECMVVVEGSFTVKRNGGWVADLHVGDFMGEVALLTSEPRNATVTAAEDSTVYAFSRREFSSLLHECPALSTRVLETADGRTLVA